jgi:peptide deformylase
MSAEKRTRTAPRINRPAIWRDGWLVPSVATVETYRRDNSESPRLVDSAMPSSRKHVVPIKPDEMLWGSVARVAKELEAADERLRGHGRMPASIAATQIGKPVRLMLAYLSGERYIFANPHLSDQNGEQTRTESCLLLPNMAADVTRPERVQFRAYALAVNDAGVTRVEKFNEQLTGTDAVTVEHAQDHLTSRYFTRHVTQQHRPVYQIPEGEVGACGEYIPANPGELHRREMFPKDQVVAFSAGAISLNDCIIRYD